MKTISDFNNQYKDYLENGPGLMIDIPDVILYLNEIFKDLVKIPGFKYSSIYLYFGMCRIESNLEEILPFAGRILNQELEEKINFILKVEYEVRRKLKLLNEIVVNTE